MMASLGVNVMPVLPPTRDIVRLEGELSVVPIAAREDALQEAWLAHLSGRDPARAVNTLARRGRRRRMRRITAPQPS